MPQRKCAVKRLRVDKKRRLRNIKAVEDLKKSFKRLQSLLAAKNIAEAKNALLETISKLDKAASKGIIKKKTADRKKSRLSLKLNKINA